MKLSAAAIQEIEPRLILEYLGGIETKIDVQEIEENLKILEYLGGIETPLFDLLNTHLI